MGNENGGNEMQICATVTGCRAFSGTELNGCLFNRDFGNYYWTDGGTAHRSKS